MNSTVLPRGRIPRNMVFLPFRTLAFVAAAAVVLSAWITSDDDY